MSATTRKLAKLQADRAALLAACEAALPIVEAAGCGGWVPEPEIEAQLRAAIKLARGDS